MIHEKKCGEFILADGVESYRKFLAGDKYGIQELVEQFRDGLILYINTFVGDINESEDLAEDVFVELIIKKPHFKGQSSFKTWLYSIARHKAMNFIKRNSRTSCISDEVLSTITGVQDFEKDYLSEQKKIILNNAMRQLKEEYRQVLHLSFLEEFTNDEIARITKKTKRQIENLLYRSKLSLRKELEKEGFDNEEL